MALEFGNAAIRLSLLSDGVEKQLNSFQSKFENVGKSILSTSKNFALVGGAITAPFAAGIKTLLDTAGPLNGFAKRTGISVEELQHLGFAAEQSGGSLEGVGNAALDMGTLLLMAGRGSKKATDTLRDLGVSLDSLDGLTPAQKFLKFADAISKIEDPLRQAALAQKVFGGSGVELLPLLKKGSAGIKELTEKSKSLGPELTAADAQGASKLKMGMRDLAEATRRLSLQLGLAVAGPLTSYLNMLTPIVAGVAQWASEHRTLSGVVGGTGASLGGIAAFGVAWAGVAYGLAKAFKVLGFVWSVLVEAFEVGMAIVEVIAVAVEAPILAVVGVIVAAITAIIAAVLWATGKLHVLTDFFKTVKGWLGFGDSKATVTATDATKVAGATNLGGMANAHASDQRGVTALFDPKLVRQTIGADSIQNAQLGVLKSIDRKIGNLKPGVPVK